MLYERLHPHWLFFFHIEMPFSMHFCLLWLLQPLMSFFSATQWSKDKACALCSLYVCVCVEVCVAGSESEVGLQSKSAGPHLLLWGLHNMAPIYNIIQSVPFRSEFLALFTRHYSHYSNSILYARAIKPGQGDNIMTLSVLMQTTVKSCELVEANLQYRAVSLLASTLKHSMLMVYCFRAWLLYMSAQVQLYCRRSVFFFAWICALHWLLCCNTGLQPSRMVILWNTCHVIY